MLKLMNKQNAIKAIKVGGLVAAGAVATRVGGSLLRRVDAVRDFAAKGAMQSAVVDAAGGVLLGGLVIAGLAAAGKSKIAAATAPFIFGGVVVAALGPAVVDKVGDAIDGAISKMMPGGIRRPLRLMQPVVPAMPGGLVARRTAGVALGGSPGGLMARRMGGVATGGAPF